MITPLSMKSRFVFIMMKKSFHSIELIRYGMTPITERVLF
jgi:hypothetical protein